MEPPKSETNPFVGAGPIQTGQVLFGRDDEVELLTNLLIARRIVLLHSPSGAGKSSLINAGLIPALQQESFDVLPIIRVNKPVPPEVLAVSDPSRINRYIVSTLLSLDNDPSSTMRRSAAELSSMCLADYLLERRAQGDPERPMMLIFDQFEEILTTDPIDLPVKKEFFRQVGEALEDRRLWALFAMREDFVGGLDPYLKHLPTQLSARARLDLLSKDAAELAIRRPAEDEKAQEGGIFNTFTPQAASLLADDLRTMLVQEESGKRMPQPGPYVEPVQLQVVCQRLWENRASEGPVDEQELSSAGTVNEALAGYFADSVKQIAKDLKDRNVREWMIRDWFDRKLITAGGIRGQVMMGEGQTEGLDNEAIQRLMDRFLVREERRRGVTWYELAHDRLVDPIRQDNGRWRRENLSRYHERSLRYVNEGRPKTLLLNQDEVKEMELWESSHQGDLTYEEEELLETSRAELHDQSKHRRRRLALDEDLSQLGWGVIFCETADPELSILLADLLNLRQGQAGEKFQKLVYKNNPPETATQFLARHGAVAGLVDPAVLPYYLLLVGSPEDIPLDFQYQLDQHYAVGRLWLEQPEDLRTYARSVVMAETGQVRLKRRAALFIPSHPDDSATRILADGMLPVLRQRLQAADMDPYRWEYDEILAEAATRFRLRALMEGDPPPLVAVFSHGMNVPYPDQLGALVTADWKGSKGPQLTPEMLFQASDVPENASLLGTVVLLSASYSAGGAPGWSDYAFRRYSSRKTSGSATPILARLPQRLLGHPLGGALAVIAHIDDPYLLDRGVSEGPLFSELMLRMMAGSSVGAAMSVLNERYAFYASRLSDLMRQQMIEAVLKQAQTQAASNLERETETLMIGLIDARNYILLGDPAVRLPLAENLEEARRPALSPPPVEKGLEAAESIQYQPSPVPPPPPVQEARMPRPVAGYPNLAVHLSPVAGGEFQVSTHFSTPGSELELRAGPLPLPPPDFDRLRSLHGQPDAYAQELTQLLFGLEEIRSAFSQARDMAQSLGLPLRLRLVIDPEESGLQDLHWETLRDPTSQIFLAGCEDILFTRFLDLPSPIHLSPRPRKLRVLAITGESLPSAEGALADADEAIASYFPNMNVITAQAADLWKAVSEQAGFDILFLASDQLPMEREALLSNLEAVQKSRDRRDLPGLVVLLYLPELPFGPHPGGEAPRRDASGIRWVAEAIARLGVPAVLAIPEETGPESTGTFLPIFFRELARDGMVDRAAGAARFAILDRPDAWRPLLFSRLRDGLLWLQPADASARMAPFQAPQPPEVFVGRAAELEQLSERLLHPESDARPVALAGGPGSGKSALAAAACHTGSVKSRFTGGILWVNLAAQPTTPKRLFDSLTGALTGESPRSSSQKEARELFLQASLGEPVLLVLDEVQERDNLEPLLAELPGCTRLVITRRRSLLPDDALEIGPLKPADAARLLAANLPGADPLPGDLAALAVRLGCWPLALRQANELLKRRTSELNQGLPDAVAYLIRSLDRSSSDVLGLKPVLASALQSLGPSTPMRYAELSIFPPGKDLPLSAIERLWARTSPLNAAGIRSLLDRLFDHCLLTTGQEAGGLRTVPGPVDFAGSFWIDVPFIHSTLLETYKREYNLSDWASLPQEETYLWQHLSYHLARANRTGELDALLRDPNWMLARLENAGPTGLLRDYLDLPRSLPGAMVGDALRISAGVLAQDSGQLPAQLLGRLYGSRSELKDLIKAARSATGGEPFLPVFPSLTATDGPLIGSYAAPGLPVTCLAFSPRGDRAVLGTSSGLYAVDLDTGRTAAWEETGAVSSMVLQSSGQTLVAWEDGRLDVWSLAAGERTAVLEKADPDRAGHRFLALIEPGPRPAADPEETGRNSRSDRSKVLNALAAGAAILMVGEPGGKIHFYRLDTADRIHTWRRKKAGLQALAFLPDDLEVLALYADGSWTVRPLSGSGKAATGKLDGRSSGMIFHQGSARWLAAQADGEIVFSDPLHKAETPPPAIRGLVGRTHALAALSNGQTLAVSSGMLQTWEAGGGEPTWSLPAAGEVDRLAVSPDGQRVITAGGSSLVQLWAPERARGWSGTGLRGRALALEISLEAQRAVTVLDDATVVMFDLESGRQRVYRENAPETGPVTKMSRAAYDQAAQMPAREQNRPLAAAIAGERLKVLLASPEVAVVHWNPETGRSRREVLPGEPFTRAAVDPLGQVAVLVDTDNQVQAWDIVRHAPLTGKIQVERGVESIAVSPDRTWFAAGGSDGRWQAWGLPDADPIASGEAESGQPVSALALAENQAVLAAAAGGGVQVWRRGEGSAVIPLVPDPAGGPPVASLRLTPDGRYAAAAAGTRVYLLDIENERILASFFTDVPVRLAAISQDGRYVAAADRGGSIHLLRHGWPTEVMSF